MIASTPAASPSHTNPLPYAVYNPLRKDLQLHGAWLVPLVGGALRKLPLPLPPFSGAPLCVSAEHLTALDVGSLMALHTYYQQLTAAGWQLTLPTSDLITRAQNLLTRYPPNPDFTTGAPSSEVAPSATLLNRIKDLSTHLGESTYRVAQLSCQMVAFLGEVVLTLLSLLRHPQHFPLKSTVANVYRVGFKAMPIIALTAFLIGIVLAYQGITQLERFGAQIYTVNLLALGILREVGVLITAVVVAGRSGSAFTAELGMMKVNEEISALKVMGLNPLVILVIPRIMALTIALPLLSFMANMVALAGGAVIMATIMQTHPAQYISQLSQAITPMAFWVGIIKAPFFGFIIGFVGCFEGFQVSGSAQSVGVHTTKSVVESIFLVIILDAAFSIIYALLKV